MSEKEQKLSAIPSMDKFCLEVPLYKSFEFNESNLEALLGINYFESTFDCYCIQCGRSSVFKSEGILQDYNRQLNHLTTHKTALLAWFAEKEVIERKFYCSRNNQHLIIYLFLRHNSQILKIGQYPSLADLAEGDINKYQKVLGEESLREFKRAVGLSSHGIGIGAFVYLRRIFEKLIEDAHQKAPKVDRNWDEETYTKSRIDEKIGLLKDYLPNFLAENKSLYGILSKGIHELSEKECLKYFSIVKVGIEMILDEKLKEKEQEQKLDEARKAIKSLTQKIK